MSVRHGFTLVEMMVGVALGSLVVMAAVGFAGHQVATLGKSNQVLEMTQVGRAALDLVADDVMHAGVGVGYQSNGNFGGIEAAGAYSFQGLNLSSDNRAITVNEEAGPLVAPTDDLVLSLADGDTVTVVNYAPGPKTGQICAPADGGVRMFENGPASVVLRDQFGLAAVSGSLAPISAVPAATLCADGATCEAAGGAMGCIDFSFTPDGVFQTDASAINVDYSGGSAASGFRRVAWYIDTDAGGRPQLRRVTSADLPCGGLGDQNCGTLIADDVESLHFRLYTFTAGAWVDVTNAGAPIATRDPVRVDLELVVRTRAVPEEAGQHSSPSLVLEGDTCLFGGGAPPCPASHYLRSTFRTSIDIKNSGYMSYL
ncbi:MAG: prepilin-type N-terminal cleavage/methylation domain-containing protein [Myxococcota bacterium]